MLFVSDEATRAAAQANGLPFQPWRTAPNREAGGRVDDPLYDWKARTPIGVVRAVCDAVMCAPAERYAADTLAAIDGFRPDVIVTNELLFGVMAAAERREVPLALLTGNLWCFPTREDLPPFGPAFPPARNAFERHREAGARRIIARLYDIGLKDLNRCRGALGLEPLAAVLDQLAAARLTVLGVARTFDYGEETPPGVVYAGPIAPPPAWAGDASPPTPDGSDPVILVSFSTTFQDEARIVGRCIEALGDLPVQGLVTLGPALAGARLPRRANVHVVERLSHDAVIDRCAAMICHGGHGTLIRPIMHGVPVLSIPTGRDQPENAQRVRVKGAGLTLPRRASAASIRRSLRTLLENPSYARSAKELGAAITAESDGGLRAAEAIEALAG